MHRWLNVAVPPTGDLSALHRWRTPSTNALAPTSVQLLVWNIDYASPHPYTRLLRILSYLEQIAKFRSGSPSPCCILLQEVAMHVFPSLLAHQWVRTNFLVVPSGPDRWPPGTTYGNVTLVSKAVPFLSAQLLVFGNSTMGRSALFVDIALRDPRSARHLTLRLANTHLESLPDLAPARYEQLSAIAHKLREPGLYGGVVAGDMNTLRPSDEIMHTRAGLLDAYKDDPRDRESFTWGFQPPSHYPPGRLDRIYYTPGKAVSDGYPLYVYEPEVMGINLKTEYRTWASDHRGLISRVRFSPVAPREVGLCRLL
ncbi:uncharacterized protein FIBRA_03454 [Fibroporia radiculosa]|uniref:Endonuclease/exonuclease/phosphatase domain-containing protein n=1 Tax=Fibroporia radiculosa TaxID=599839 RepID=J4G5J9_9APHY|nr:uncharacterized protein FIBRA_03454 [Fibroporia radiculosa]CCM01403.1 predicted protein [Fibroporia radiculosa]